MASRLHRLAAVAFSTIAALGVAAGEAGATRCLDGGGAALLNAAFADRVDGLNGADYQRAIALPDGRTLWTLQDAFVTRPRRADRLLHNVAVVQAKWFVDGVEVGWDGAAPWAATWNANSLPAGWHSIQARAADAANNWASSPTVWFQVGSTATPGGWTLVQSDDFNGSSVDTSKWRVYGPWIPASL